MRQPNTNEPSRFEKKKKNHKMFTFIELYAGAEKFIQHVMRNGSRADMFNDNFHLRIVRETSILLVEAKMGGMQMQYKGGRVFSIFIQDIGRCFNYNVKSVNATVVRIKVRKQTIWFRVSFSHSTISFCSCDSHGRSM